MSRFVDTATTVEVDLGPCQCPQTPHERDIAMIRTHLSGVDMLAIGAAGDDTRLQILRLLNRGIAAWNLTDEKKKPVPITPETVGALDSETAAMLATECDKQFLNNELPNGSSVRSQDGSPANASRTRKTEKKPSSTDS